MTTDYEKVMAGVVATTPAMRAQPVSWTLSQLA
jgi:hypothetical protein